MAYESGIALQSIRKQMKDAPCERNKGVAPANRRCKYYHPNYCTALGHADARSKGCYANLLSITDRNIVLQTIFDEAVKNQMSLSGSDGKYINLFDSCLNKYNDPNSNLLIL